MEHLSPYFIGAFVFVFGLLFGSFLNVVIYRVPKGESIVLPASHCPACNAAIKPYDNIPVLSFAILGGKCRNCGVVISPIYPAVELLVGILYLLAFIKAGQQSSIFTDAYDSVPARFWMTMIADILFISFIVPLVFIDLKHKLLPNVITFPGIAVLLIARVIAPDRWIVDHTPTFGLTIQPEWQVALVASVLGALVGGGSLWLVRWIYFQVRHVEGLGLGDVKMMLMVGVFLGLQLTVLTIFVGALLGSILGIGLIALRRGSMKMEIPFGVFLGIAGLIALFVGPSLVTWYMGTYR
jgi:leader peptidase (prepilin peptidase)/N-methyltransferase